MMDKTKHTIKKKFRGELEDPSKVYEDLSEQLLAEIGVRSVVVEGKELRAQKPDSSLEMRVRFRNKNRFETSQYRYTLMTATVYHNWNKEYSGKVDELMSFMGEYRPSQKYFKDTLANALKDF